MAADAESRMSALLVSYSIKYGMHAVFFWTIWSGCVGRHLGKISPNRLK